MGYQIYYRCLSHTGLLRESNQDNLLCRETFLPCLHDGTEEPLCGTLTDRESALFAVFDGMGGASQGEVASWLAAKTAAQWRMEADPVAMLDALCQKANVEVCDYVQEQQLASMGTTAAMLLCHKHGLVLCNLGDSRIYRLSAQGLEQVSQDHTAPPRPGGKAPLSQYLGIPPQKLRLQPSFARGGYQDGDVYLLCTDGLTDMVGVGEIEEILRTAPQTEAADRLLQRALEHGGRDNVTLVTVYIRKKKLFERKEK